MERKDWAMSPLHSPYDMNPDSLRLHCGKQSGASKLSVNAILNRKFRGTAACSSPDNYLIALFAWSIAHITGFFFRYLCRILHIIAIGIGMVFAA